jgi:hypothetical protein
MPESLVLLTALMLRYIPLRRPKKKTSPIKTKSPRVAPTPIPTPAPSPPPPLLLVGWDVDVEEETFLVELGDRVPVVFRGVWGD